METKQLLKNYSYMLLKEINRTPKDKVGDIEFYTEELKRIEQSLQGGKKESE